MPVSRDIYVENRQKPSSFLTKFWRSFCSNRQFPFAFPCKSHNILPHATPTAPDANPFVHRFIMLRILI